MDKILNGKQIPNCMIGTWAWGTGANGAKIVFGKVSTQEQLQQVFTNAYESGFVFWDTAEVYGMGNSERILGGFISEKEDVLISTKHFPNKKYRQDENRNAIKGSLERLNIDVIDLYWLHKPLNLEQNMKELAECQKDGLIRSIGLSNGSVEQIKEADRILRQNGSRLVAVQNHYSLLSMEREADMLDYCLGNDILFFGYMILEQGALSGHYDEKNCFPLFSMRRLMFGKVKFKKIRELLSYIKKLGDQYGIDSSQIPIAWAIAKGVIPIVGLTKPSHAVSLRDGTRVTLTPEEIKTLEDLALDSGVKCKGAWE